MFVEHAVRPAWGSGWLMTLPHNNWKPQQQDPVTAALSQQFQMHPALTAAAVGGSSAGGGVQQQLVSLLGYLAKQHNEPEMYCLDADLLSRCC
jgi:hypothetical protein